MRTSRPASVTKPWLRSASAGLEPSAVVRYSLPDALWQLSFTTLVWLAWRSHPWNAAKLLCCAAPIAIGLGCELGQLVGWVEGVFDPADLALSVLAIAAAVALVRQPRPSRAGTALRPPDRARGSSARRSGSGRPRVRGTTAGRPAQIVAKMNSLAIG